MVQVKENGNLLLGTANTYLLGQPESPLVTNHLEMLDRYKVTEPGWRDFLEHFNSALQ